MPIFEERTIYRVGKSSLVITLPQNWLKFFGLTAGDVVEITGNGDLTIRPRQRTEDGKAPNSQVALISRNVHKYTQDGVESV